MYCPVCFQDTLRIRSNGVIKLSFNGKSRNTSLFTFNLQKENHEELHKKLREKVVEFMNWYAQFKNKDPIRTFEAYSNDFNCMNGCKIDMVNTKFSVIGSVYKIQDVKQILSEEGTVFNIPIQVTFN